MLNQTTNIERFFNKYKIFIYTFFPILICDQYIKNLVYTSIPLQEGFSIFSFLNIVHIRNFGISFGLLKAYNLKFILVIFQLIIILWLFSFYKTTTTRHKNHHKFCNFCYSLIISGAFGNILDRLIYGSVIDFIDFYLPIQWLQTIVIPIEYIMKFFIKNYTLTFTQPLHWPAFNIADISICIGGCCLIIIDCFMKEKQR